MTCRKCRDTGRIELAGAFGATVGQGEQVCDCIHGALIRAQQERDALVMENADLRRECERLRQERNEARSASVKCPRCEERETEAERNGRQIRGLAQDNQTLRARLAKAETALTVFRGGEEEQVTSLAARLLRARMEALSESGWCASWSHGLEYELWKIAEAGVDDLCGQWPVSAEEMRELQELSQTAGGWWAWGEAQGGPRFVALDEWERLVAEKGGQR